jgi:hypothetical protein
MNNKKIKGYFWAKFALVLVIICIGGAAVFVNGESLISFSTLSFMILGAFIGGEGWNYKEKKKTEARQTEISEMAEKIDLGFQVRRLRETIQSLEADAADQTEKFKRLQRSMEGDDVERKDCGDGIADAADRRIHGSV